MSTISMNIFDKHNLTYILIYRTTNAPEYWQLTSRLQHCTSHSTLWKKICCKSPNKCYWPVVSLFCQITRRFSSVIVFWANQFPITVQLIDAIKNWWQQIYTLPLEYNKCKLLRLNSFGKLRPIKCEEYWMDLDSNQTKSLSLIY